MDMDKEVIIPEEEDPDLTIEIDPNASDDGDKQPGKEPDDSEDASDGAQEAQGGAEEEQGEQRTEETFRALEANLTAQRDALREQNANLQEQLNRKRAGEIDSQQELLEQHIASTTAQAQSAEYALGQALQAQDYTEAAKQQRILARAEAHIVTLNAGLDSLEEAKERSERSQTQQRPPQQQSRQEVITSFISQFSRPTQQWLNLHKDDIFSHQERGNLVFATHKVAVSRGMKPDTDEYFRFLDESMGYKNKMQNQTKRMPAAPPSRRSGGNEGQKKTVTLTQIEQEVAKEMGVTNAEYAKNKLEIQEGKAEGYRFKER